MSKYALRLAQTKTQFFCQHNWPPKNMTKKDQNLTQTTQNTFPFSPTNLVGLVFCSWSDPKSHPWHRDALAAWFWASNSSSIWVSWQVPSPFHHLPWCASHGWMSRWCSEVVLCSGAFCPGGEVFEPKRWRAKKMKWCRCFCGKTWGLHDLNSNAMVNE